MKSNLLIYKIVVHYIFLNVIRLNNPWNFFGLNSQYFNKEKKIFSKWDLNFLIPVKWRLEQIKLDDIKKDSSFPLFLKPEWGQNSYSIKCVNSYEEFELHCKTLNNSDQYFAQIAAKDNLEFEVFYVKNPKNLDEFSILSLTETINIKKIKHPINSIFNKNTIYKNIVLTTPQKNIIWEYLKTIGDLKIARVCVKTSSIESFFAGDFKIVEINIFTPMPLCFLDKSIKKNYNKVFFKSLVFNLACLTDKSQGGLKIFLQMLKKHFAINKSQWF